MVNPTQRGRNWYRASKKWNSISHLHFSWPFKIWNYLKLHIVTGVDRWQLEVEWIRVWKCEGDKKDKTNDKILHFYSYFRIYECPRPPSGRLIFWCTTQRQSLLTLLTRLMWLWPVQGSAPTFHQASSSPPVQSISHGSLLMIRFVSTSIKQF